MNTGYLMSRRVPALKAANDRVRFNFDRVPAVDAPEETLVISFSGISRAEQRAALAGFPGGKRFVLADEAA
jgi:hypothetical protein